MRLFPWNRRTKKESPPMEGRAPGRTIQPLSEGAEGARRLLSYQVANLQGVGTCESQEDAFAFSNALDVTMIREKGFLAVVADGMGGMREGQLASETVVSSIRQDFSQFDYQSDIAWQLYESVSRASKKVFSILEGEGGSTVVACIVYQECLYFVSVGDSYLFLKRNGQIFRLNRPQNILYDSFLQSIHDGTMDPKIAEQNHEKAALTQFLGMEVLGDVDLLYRPLPLISGDVLLLCSDGVAGAMTETQVLDCLMKSTPKEICGAFEYILKEAPAGQYQDNYTALVIQCEY